MEWTGDMWVLAGDMAGEVAQIEKVDGCLASLGWVLQPSEWDAVLAIMLECLGPSAASA